MDYRELALEFMKKMFALNKARPQRQFQESMQGETVVLQYLSDHEDSVLPSEISAFMGISSARIAATLNSLEKKEFITRRIDLSDRRRILVEITPKGRALAGELKADILENTSKMLAFLGEHDAREYIRITGRMAEFASELTDRK